MAYRCPACDEPQADGEHLANHLALTAMTRGGEHAEWLDEHAPGWEDDSPGELADRIVDHAEETEHEPPGETGGPPEPPTGAGGAAGPGPQFDGVVDAAVEEVLDEARELTEEMFESGADEGASGGGDGSEPRDDRGSETQDE